MKYYWLTNCIVTKEVGVFPQSEEAKSYGSIRDLDYDANIIDNLIPPEPIVKVKAKLTTYLHPVYINFLKFLCLRKDFISFFKDFNISEFQTWDMKVHHKGKVIDDYILFHLSYPSQKKYIDYKNSEFYIGKLTDYKYVGDNIKVSSYDDFLTQKDSLRNKKLILKGKKIVFDLRKANEDLLRITDTVILGSSGYYISEKLKNAIEDKGFTGMEFKELDSIDKRIKVIY